MNFTTILGTPHFHAVCLVLVSAAAIEALIAIWAATSPVHWVWRALAVWAAVTVLLPIRAYQPALLFALTSPLTIVLIIAITARRGTFRFGLRDLLLATALIGLALASLLHLSPRLGQVHFAEFTLTAIAQTAVPTLLWASLVTTRTRACYAALVVLIIGVSLAVRFNKPPLSYDWALIGVLFESRWQFHDVEIAAIATCELTLLLLAALRTSLFHREKLAKPPDEGRQTLARKLRSALLPFLAACWLVCLGVIYVNMLWFRPLPPRFSTQSTNYARLLEITRNVNPLSTTEKQAQIDETIALVESTNHVPYDLSSDPALDDWNKRFIGPSQNVRNLARMIDAEVSAARSQGDLHRACTLAITNLRLGLMLQRGSTVIESLIGVAVQGLANQRLIEMRGELSPDDARRIIAAWERALSEAESVEAIINRDAAIAERAYGWAARLANILDWAGLPTVYSSVREAWLRREATARLIQTDLAVRLYQQEHGRLPAKLDQLIPAYLPALPPDPYSNQPLIYRTNGHEFTLYSVGLDRTDNGGKFTNMRTYYSRDFWDNFVTGYDYDLETATRP